MPTTIEEAPPPKRDASNSQRVTSKALEWVKAVALPAAVVLGGWWVSAAAQNRTVEVRLVETAIQILQAPPSDSTKPIREWATDVINKYSEVKLSTETKGSLIDSVPLPPSNLSIRSSANPFLSFSTPPVAFGSSFGGAVTCPETVKQGEDIELVVETPTSLDADRVSPLVVHVGKADEKVFRSVLDDVFPWHPHENRVALAADIDPGTYQVVVAYYLFDARLYGNTPLKRYTVCEIQVVP